MENRFSRRSLNRQWDYINHIHNESKREYAKMYFRWLNWGHKTGDPQPQPFSLSYMGAQAVRQRLADLIE